MKQSNNLQSKSCARHELGAKLRGNPLAVVSCILMTLTALTMIITAFTLSIKQPNCYDYEDAIVVITVVLVVAFSTLILSIIAATLKNRTKILAIIGIIISVILLIVGSALLGEYELQAYSTRCFCFCNFQIRK